MGLKAILMFPIIFGVSCSSVNRIALNSTAKIMAQGADQMNHEPNWHLFQSSVPANIKMIESMSFADPENLRFLGMLAKAYGGYAFGVHETLYLDDFLADKWSGFHKDQAVSAYTKALNYGLDYFELKGIERELVFSKDAAKELPKRLDDKMDEEDLSAVFYTAQSLGGLINLQKSNMALLGSLGAVKAMMDWVCEDNMDFELGSCRLFYAVYEAGRPPMMGGDLERGKKLFLEFIEKYPLNLLGRITYIQHYVIPMMDEVEYARQREKLIKEFAEWEKVKNAGETSPGAKKYRAASRFNLFNAIARERFKIIEKRKNNIF